MSDRPGLERCTALEQQNGDLTHLYVAGARLHSSLQPQEVFKALREITCDLIGAAEVAVFRLDRRASALSLIACFGIQSVEYRTIPVGTGRIGGVALTGEPYIRSAGDEPDIPTENHLTACFPMKLEGRLFGAIAIFRLLGQKTTLEPLDYELLDFLSTHAALAIHCADLHEKFCASAVEAN